MAVKKCDEVTDQLDESAEAAETQAEQASPGPVNTRINTVSKVRANTHLGKIFQAVERTIYDDLMDDPSDITGQLAEIMETNAMFGNGYIRQYRPRDIADPLRAEARKFFTAEYMTSQINYVNNNLNAGSNTNQAYDAVYGESVLKIVFDNDPQESQAQGDLFKVYNQNVTVTTDKFISNSDGVTDEAVLEAAFVAYVNGEPDTVGMDMRNRGGKLIDISTDYKYTDHYTNITIPFSKDELERYVNNINNPQYADVEPKYNFFLAGYEGYIENSATELQLPNLYSGLTKDAAGETSMQWGMETLGQAFFPNAGSFEMSYVRGVQAIDDSWISQGSTARTDKFKNIGIPSSQVSVLQQGSFYDDLRPMNNTVVLETDKNGKLITAAETAGMTDELVQFVMNETYGSANQLVVPQTGDQSIVTGLTNTLLFQTSIEKMAATGSTALENERRGSGIGIDAERIEQELQITDFGRWLQHSYLDDSATYYEFPNFEDNSIMLGLPEGQTTQACSAFLDTLRSLVLTGKVGQIVEENFRTFGEMLEGEEAYNETVIYEIVKTSSSPNSPTQRIFVPNTEELNVLQYIDTQVKYGGSGIEYTYEIFAHQLIVGTQYRYTGRWNTSAGPSNVYSVWAGGRMVQFGVEYKPSLQIVRLPIYKETEKILDAPPIFPNVDLVPYKDVPTRFLINLSSNVGKYTVQPVEINNKDKQFIQAYRASKKLKPDEPIEFKSDDPTKKYEIYRMSVPPRSYQDFAGHLLQELSSDTATAISYVDNIIPNQKYYYMFRSVDVHGNRSNPSDVYQIELVNFEGMTFFNDKMYEFEDRLRNNNNVSNSIDLKRYLKINPNFIQSLVNYEETFPSVSHTNGQMQTHASKAGHSPSAYLANDVVLGQADEGIWNKRFKVRVTSKNSGKKFDLNITCKVNYTKTTKPN
jgi:hypothetical protein